MKGQLPLKFGQLPLKFGQLPLKGQLVPDKEVLRKEVLSPLHGNAGQ